MRIVLTGADGFLGWHLRVRLHALTGHQVDVVNRENWSELPVLVRAADAIIHVAGVNRGPEPDVEQGNIDLARDVAAATRQAGAAPRIVFANSTQSGNGTPYGTGKAIAAEVLADAANEGGARYVDVRLPNLFGEHGRPGYNSFVATFARAVIDGTPPQIVDRPVGLLHVQVAAQSIIDALTTDAKRIDPAPVQVTVAGVLDRLRQFNATYAPGGDIPSLTSDMDVDLFNTLRAARFPAHYPIPLVPRADDRGRLVETVRAHGSAGQTFVSTTKPGIIRGEHFHLRKIERFAVISGRARISLRRVFHSQVISFEVDGRTPVAVDMPTMWVHNIQNTGDDELVTQFWTNELFDPDNPDTHPEPVSIREKVAAPC